MDHEHDDHLEDDLYYDSCDGDEYNDDDENDVDGQGSTIYHEEPAGKLRPVEWMTVRIDGVILNVSNRGVIQKLNDVFSGTKGFVLIGTPYRTYMINYKEYYVHDIVWRAFNGDAPEGWEIRHKSTQRRKYYDNSLHHLDIYPATVETRPQLFSSPPKVVS